MKIRESLNTTGINDKKDIIQNWLVWSSDYQQSTQTKSSSTFQSTDNQTWLKLLIFTATIPQQFKRNEEED